MGLHEKLQEANVMLAEAGARHAELMAENERLTKKLEAAMQTCVKQETKYQHKRDENRILQGELTEANDERGRLAAALDAAIAAAKARSDALMEAGDHEWLTDALTALRQGNWVVLYRADTGVDLKVHQTPPMPRTTNVVLDQPPTDPEVRLANLEAQVRLLARQMYGVPNDHPRSLDKRVTALEERVIELLREHDANP